MLGMARGSLFGVIAGSGGVAPPGGGANQPLNSVYFDEVTDTGLQSTTSSITANPGAVTISILVKPGLITRDSLYTLFYNATPSLSVFLETTGQIRWYMRNTSGSAVDIRTNTGAVTANTWQLLTMSYDVGSAQYQIAVNGVVQTISSASGLITPNWGPGNSMAVGVGSYTNQVDTYDVNGDIAYIWMNETYLDLNQTINMDYYWDSTKMLPVYLGTDGTNSGLPQPYVYHYGDTTTFNNNNGSWVYILAPNLYSQPGNGSTVDTWDPNGGYIPPPVGRTPKTVTAYNGTSIDNVNYQVGTGSATFDGIDDYIRVDDPSGEFLFGVDSDFTIEFWYKKLSTNLTEQIAANRSAFTTGNWYMQFDHTTDKIQWGVSGAAAQRSTTNFDNTLWHHIALQRTGTTFTLYINGALENTLVGSYQFGRVLDPFIDFGRIISSAGNQNLDEIRVSNIQRYNSAFTPSTTQFYNDANTLLLLHLDTDFNDDTGDYTPPPGPVSGGETNTVLDLRELSMQYHNGAQYVGTNTQGEPVFLTINQDPSGGNGNIKYQMFSVSTDSTVTKGTVATVFPSNALTAFRWTSERSAEGAGYNQEMMEQNYGVGTFAYTSSVNQWYAVAFEIDVDAKTITLGTPTAWGGSDTSSSAWDIAYMGNGKYYAFDRGGNNDSYMITQTITRVGNLVTLSSEDYNVGASGGMGFGEVIGFPNQSVAYTAMLNNADGVGVGVQRLNGSVYLDGNGNNVAFNAGEVGNGGETNSGAPTIHKVDNNRFIAVALNTQNGIIGTFTRVIDTNWNSGSTPPTTTAGPIELLTSATSFGTPVVCPRPITPNTVRLISERDWTGTASGKWQYHDLNVTGTTITQGTWQELATTVNMQDSYNATSYSDGVNTYTVITYEELGTSNIGVITLVD